MSGALTIAGVVRRVQQAEALDQLQLHLRGVEAKDPTLRALRLSQAKFGWNDCDTMVYMILAMQERAERAEQRLLELLRTGIPPVYIVSR